MRQRQCGAPARVVTTVVAVVLAAGCTPSEDSAGAAISADHVREVCGAWQDHLDTVSEPSNYFTQNLEATQERLMSLRADMATAANRSGNADISEAAATFRRVFDRSRGANAVGQQLDEEEIATGHAAGDVLTVECRDAGFATRDTRGGGL